MANELIGKHLVRIESPTTRGHIRFGYPTLQAKNRAIALDRGYEILAILAIRPPTPNRPTGD